MEALNSIATALGAESINTVFVWVGAGFLLGLIMIGRRPLGLIGDLLLGIIGGVAGGWVFLKFAGGLPALDLAAHVTNLATRVGVTSLTETSAGYIGAFLEALIGALLLLILTRLFVRR
jgi:uncharacterized membrane protein YeaQ/YmgE (transglycosylase-associated protein family)